MDTQQFSFSEKATKKALENIYSMSYLGIGGHFIVVFVTAYLFLDEVKFPLIAMGVIFQSLVLLGRAYTVYRYQQVKIFLNNMTSVKMWLRYYLYGSFASGLAWGLSVILIMQTTDIMYHFFFLLSLSVLQEQD